MAGRKRKGSSGLGTLIAIAFVLVVLAPGYVADIPWTSLLVLLGAVVVIVWLLRRLAGPKTPTARELAARFAGVSAMSGAQFEIFVADLFRAMGHPATVLGGSGDQGVDVIVQYQGERVAVQCKNYKRTVGNKPVQEVYAGARHHGCSQAWVVAPAGYTKGAVELARSVGVKLFDANAIRGWIKKVDAAEKERERTA